MIVYSLAPFFARELGNLVKSCDFYVIGFYEFMNKYSQKQQMDIMLRFLDLTVQNVKSRYFTFTFLNSTTAEDLLNTLKKHWLSGI